MQTTLLNEIISFIFGRKYYLVVENTVGTTEIWVDSRIYPSKEKAMEQLKELEHNRSYRPVCIVSFRSRKNLV